MSFSDQFQQLSEQKNRIDGLLSDLNLDYINKIKGRFINEKEPYEIARNSFIFRMRAIGFHLRTMMDYIELIPQRLRDLDCESRKVGRSSVSLYIGREFGVDVLHLFESLLFNIVSFVDYSGTLVCCCLEQQNIQKWDGLRRACYDKENLFNSLKLADSVKLFENDFVDRLYKLRSVIIHNRNIGIDINSSWKVRENEYEVTILAPQAEVKKFVQLKHLEHISLMDFTFWLLNQTFNGVEKILIDLRIDIEMNRKIPSGKEVIIK